MFGWASVCRGARGVGMSAVIAVLAFDPALILGGGAAQAQSPQLASPRPTPLHRQSVPGPVPAKVLRVIDGDTLMVRARIWIVH